MMTDSKQIDDGAISTLLDAALLAMSGCEHDGGFDREIGPIGCSLNEKCVCIGVYPLVAKARAHNQGNDPVCCPCTMFEQDEDCPEGYPSMLCGICKGTGNTTQEQVTALAVEMLKIASDVGEPEDPFAAWESIELIRSNSSDASEARS